MANRKRLALVGERKTAVTKCSRIGFFQVDAAMVGSPSISWIAATINNWGEIDVALKAG